MDFQSIKSVFDFVVPLFSCEDMFKIRDFGITVYLLAIPS